jgi:hypothetical protein
MLAEMTRKREEEERCRAEELARAREGEAAAKDDRKRGKLTPG